MQNNQMQNNQFNNKDGRGIFYGVIAVATLIVAIIGATFAYFTASAQSSENALAATAATVSINYTEGRSIQATNLIPSSPEVITYAYSNPTAEEYNEANKCDTEAGTCETAGATPKSVGDVGTKCVDDNGYFVCAWYEFTVANESNITQAISAYMTINVNQFTTLDKASVAQSKYVATKEIWETGDSHENLALKFMTIRSADTVDTTVAQCAESSGANTDFCKTGENGAVTTDKDTAFSQSSYTDTATGKVYYFYNTTAVRQSMWQVGSPSQYIFEREIIPSAAVGADGKVLKTCDEEGVQGNGNLVCATNRTFYVLVWLEENEYTGVAATKEVDGKQVEYKAQDIDQGKSYGATITVQAVGSDAGDSSGGYVTGTQTGQ